MSKKKRKKRRKPSQIRSIEKVAPQEVKKEEKIIAKKPKKILIYVLPFLFFLIIVVLAFYFLRPKIRINRDSSLNVLLITLDTTRADRIGCYGYGKAKTPNLDSLALGGVKFLNAYCQVPLTCPSHCSILTGTYPIYHKRIQNSSFCEFLHC